MLCKCEDFGKQRENTWNVDPVGGTEKVYEREWVVV